MWHPIDSLLFVPLHFYKLLKRLRYDPISVIVQRILLLSNGNVSWPVHFTSTIRGLKYITVGSSTHPGQCPGCYIIATKNYPLRFGDNVLVSANVTIVSYNYLKGRMSFPDPITLNVGVSVGDNCWIGANSVILPGAIIENDVVIGAGSIVTRGIYKSFGVYAGNPAKLIKNFSPD